MTTRMSPASRQLCNRKQSNVCMHVANRARELHLVGAQDLVGSCCVHNHHNLRSPR